MTVCHICNKRVLTHALKIGCHVCNEMYHMKCISLTPADHVYMQNNIHNWMCLHCTSSIFPFNQIEDDNDFLLACDIQRCHELLSSDLVYNPFGSELEEIHNQIEFDPDHNFYNEQNLFNGYSCSYYLEDLFNEKLQSFACDLSQCFSLCHINIRSIKANLSHFENYLQLLSIDFPVIAITETWLNDITCDLYSLPGYNFTEQHRSDKCGGGVGIFVHDHMNYSERNDLSVFNEYCESLFIEVDRTNMIKEKNIVIGVIYRPPNTDIPHFIDIMKDTLDKIKNENKICYLVGDYNINLINIESHSLTSEFNDVMYSGGFIPLITRPTRVTQTSATLIDNIYSNQILDRDHSLNGIMMTDVSDHYPIFHVAKYSHPQNNEISITRRNYTTRNKDNFMSQLSNIDWANVFQSDSTQRAFSLFHNELRKLHDRCFPLQHISKKYNTRKPWLSDALRVSIKKKNKLYRKSVKIKSVYNEMVYKNYRNTLKHLLKAAEKKYYSELILLNKSNSKKMWSIIKNIINRNKEKYTNRRFKLSDGSITNDKKLISNKFNDFFINVGPTLANRIERQNKNPEQFMKAKVTYSLYLEPVTEQEIHQLVSSLKKSSPGYDNLSASILQLGLPEICPVLTYICNLSLMEGIFPDELKLANVIPLYKCGDYELFNNYRPVSILCTLSKVFEKIMYNRLLNYLDHYKILFSYQFGFRKLHSTYMAFMVLMDKLTKALDDGKFVVGILLDFSKAFDTVDHDILLNKLSHYGIRGVPHLWFKSYLSNRQQFVTYNGVSSSVKTVKCGVPQGSILGPLLFLIYINDLVSVCSHCFPILFADDTNLFASGNDLPSISELLSKELAELSLWLKVNRLSLNLKKTQYMIFTRKKSISEKINIKIDNQNISETKSSKFLGVYIDNSLNWKKHICYIAGKISRGIGIILKSRKYLNKESLLTLYYCFIYPFLIYCNHVWGNTYKTNLSKLQILQNQVLRIITGSKPRCHVDPLYKNLGILNLSEINVYLTGMFMYKIHNQDVPHVFDDFFMYNYEVHDHDTRSANYFHVPVIKSNLSAFGIKYHGVTIWNKILKAKLNPDCSELSFKIMLKKSILQKLVACE